MLKRALAGGVALAIAVGATVTAEPVPHDRDAMSLFGAHHPPAVTAAWLFSLQDTDGDGIVTKAERAQSTDRKWWMDFSKLDLNGDGKLTEAEYVAAFLKAHGKAPGQEV